MLSSLVQEKKDAKFTDINVQGLDGYYINMACSTALGLALLHMHAHTLMACFSSSI